MPKVIGSAMKFRNVTRTWAQPAPPTIRRTPSISVASAINAAAAGRMVKEMMIKTAINETAVAIGPSRRIERIIDAKTTAEPEVSTTLPFGRCRYCRTEAIRSRSRPFQTESPCSGG